MNTYDSLSSRRQKSLRRWFISGVATISAIAANCTFATESSDAHRFELNGSGTLVLDAPLQRNGALRLKAVLSSSSMSVDQPTLQTGNRFALTATLAAASLVCYSDTIFRDDFDGDGF